MKPIKFRIWDKKLEMFYYSKEDAIKKLSKAQEIDWFETEGNEAAILLGCLESVQEGDRYVICMYTGIKDNTGKEIYEDDLINFTINYSSSPSTWHENELVQYCEEDASFIFGLHCLGNDDYCGCLVRESLKVVGNIFEQHN